MTSYLVPFVEQAVTPPLSGMCTFVTNQLSVLEWVCVWTMNCVSVYLYIQARLLMLIVGLKIRRGDSAFFFPFFFF